MKNQDNMLLGPMETWERFPWSDFPGGVKVTLAMLPKDCSGIFLVRLNRWSYVLPSGQMNAAGCLHEFVGALARKMRDSGIIFSQDYAPVGVVVCGSVKTFHVILSVEVQPSTALELVSKKKPHMLTGLVGDDEFVQSLMQKLGWVPESTPAAIAA